MLDGTSDGTSSTTRDTPATTPSSDGGEAPVKPQAQKAADGVAKRERLAALVAGGQSQQYLGIGYTIEQIDSLPPDKVERLYICYESRLGAVMTKTLGQAVIQLYTAAIGRVFPKIQPEDLSALTADLNADLFLGHALNGACCELYHRYGMWLAPLTTVLTTAKHCRFERADQHSVVSISDGGREASEGPKEGGGRPEGSTCPKGEA